MVVSSRTNRLTTGASNTGGYFTATTVTMTVTKLERLGVPPSAALTESTYELWTLASSVLARVMVPDVPLMTNVPFGLPPEML